MDILEERYHRLHSLSLPRSSPRDGLNCLKTR